MRAIDAAQLIVNRLSRTGKSIDRSDLTKMLYLLDLTVLKHTGTRLVDEEFSFNDRGPFIEDVYKHFQLWKDDYISGEVQVKHNLSEDFLKMLKEKISAIGKCKSWELDAIIYNQQNNGKTQELTDDMIDSYNKVKNEILSRCKKLLDIGEKQVEFVEYGQKAHSLQKSLPEECIGISHLDTDEVFIDIKKLDDGNYQLEWDSYDTFEGFGPEKVVMPADFIHDFDNYCEKLKENIEAHNKIEIEKEKEYKAKLEEAKCHRYDDNDKIRVFKTAQLEVEKMEAKLKAEQEKLNKLKASMADSGIEM